MSHALCAFYVFISFKHVFTCLTVSVDGSGPPYSDMPCVTCHVCAGDLVVLIQEQGVDVSASFDGGLPMMSSLSSMDEAETPAAS